MRKNVLRFKLVGREGDSVVLKTDQYIIRTSRPQDRKALGSIVESILTDLHIEIEKGLSLSEEPEYESYYDIDFADAVLVIPGLTLSVSKNLPNEVEVELGDDWIVTDREHAVAILNTLNSITPKERG